MVWVGEVLARVREKLLSEEKARPGQLRFGLDPCRGLPGWSEQVLVRSEVGASEVKCLLLGVLGAWLLFGVNSRLGVCQGWGSLFACLPACRLVSSPACCVPMTTREGRSASTSS